LSLTDNYSKLERVKEEIYLASTYLKVPSRGNNALLELLSDTLGPRASEIIEEDYLRGADIDQIFMALAKQGIDSWLLRYGKELNIATHGPLGFAVLSAPNLHTALQVLSDYIMVRSSAYRLEFSHLDQRAECVFIDQTDSRLMGRWLIETGMRLTQQLTESVLAHSLGDNTIISFAYSEPSYKDELNELFGVRCRFNADKNSISFPASWCQISSPLSDQETFKSNLAKCRELKLARGGCQEFSEIITLALNHYFEARELGKVSIDDMPTLLSLAEKQHISSRTLNRRLKAQSTSYKQLLTQARGTRACYLLQNTHLTIAEISYNLAYQEPANFVRAFKTWFDIPPAAWRRKKSTND